MNALVVRYQKKITETEISAIRLSLLTAIGLVLFYNTSWWREILTLPYEMNAWNISFFISIVIVLTALLHLILLLISLPYIQKPLLIAIIICATFSAYFMHAYGVMIDRGMVQNAIETDPAEVIELLSLRMFSYVLLLGLIPALVIYYIKIKPQYFLKELSRKLLSGLSSFAIIALIALIFYQDYASLLRNNRHLRLLLNPSNLIYATTTYLANSMQGASLIAQPIALDAVRVSKPKKRLNILIVGEAARAANFSLNGYAKNTNPNLSQQDIVYFNNVSSCGTSTAVSVPCMFSHLAKDDYSGKKAKQHQGLLDVLAQTGVDVLWRENNSGCKGTCDRVLTQDLSELDVASLCDNSKCFDETLLHQLSSFIDNSTEDMFIVLHQQGSHGPAYYKRYPKNFEVFTPVCKTNQLQNCTQQEITNAYDNTILYTDYFINRVIEFLKQDSDSVDTAMLYISDHGESLGENNIYLHGMPYFIAPKEQTHIPFLFWASEGYQKQSNLDTDCLSGKQDDAFSHDNIFHSVLGLMDISTKLYQSELDLFASCRS